MSKLLVIQPYLADYRVPFWSRVFERFAAGGVECRLAVGDPGAAHRRRQDETWMPNVISARGRAIGLGGPTVRWQRSWRHWRDYDALVLEASGSLIDTTVALLGTKPVALWGHIGSFTRPASGLDARLEAWQLRRARAVLAYTEEGGAMARSLGVESGRITVLNNTVDTIETRQLWAAMNLDSAAASLGVGEVNPAKTFAFIGGLDAPKRLGFLAAALDSLWLIDPEIRLIVAGQGADEYLLSAARDRGQVKLVGRAGPAEKAAIAHCSMGILMPGRVGLVAVESFALGLPIITTEWRFHAPEFDYLTPGSDSIVTNDSVEAFVAAVREYASNPELSGRLRRGAAAKAGWPAIDDMASRFIEGCQRLFMSE